MDGDFSSHQDDFKTCSYQFQSSSHISVRENFDALCEIQLSRLFIDSNWSLRPILGFVLQQLLPLLFTITVCEQFQTCWYSEILSSWWSQEEWLKKRARALLIFVFAISQVWEMKTHVFDWWTSINFQLLSQALFYMFPSERSSLTVTQEQTQLTWLGSIWCILTTLSFICEMRIMKARLWGSCKD